MITASSDVKKLASIPALSTAMPRSDALAKDEADQSSPANRWPRLRVAATLVASPSPQPTSRITAGGGIARRTSASISACLSARSRPELAGTAGSS